MIVEMIFIIIYNARDVNNDDYFINIVLSEKASLFTFLCSKNMFYHYFNGLYHLLFFPRETKVKCEIIL